VRPLCCPAKGPVLICAWNSRTAVPMLAAALTAGLSLRAVKCGTSGLCPTVAVSGRSAAWKRPRVLMVPPAPTQTEATNGISCFGSPAPKLSREVQQAIRSGLRVSLGHRHERPGEDGAYPACRPTKRTDLPG